LRVKKKNSAPGFFIRGALIVFFLKILYNTVKLLSLSPG